jgi:hypothetical protein
VRENEQIHKRMGRGTSLYNRPLPPLETVEIYFVVEERARYWGRLPVGVSIENMKKFESWKI